MLEKEAPGHVIDLFLSQYSGLSTRRTILSHCGLVTSYGVKYFGQNWFRPWFVACSAPSHYLNEAKVLDNWNDIDRTAVKFESEYRTFHSGKCTWKFRLWNDGRFDQASMCSCLIPVVHTWLPKRITILHMIGPNSRVAKKLALQRYSFETATYNYSITIPRGVITCVLIV